VCNLFFWLEVKSVLLGRQSEWHHSYFIYFFLTLKLKQNFGLWIYLFFGLKSFKFENETSVDNLITEIKNRIINLEHISNWKREPRYLDYIGINSKNGSIPLHFDANDGNFIHTRYNVILSYPEKGGESIYGDNINILEENMVWKCVAGKMKHGSTLVESDKRRITFSLGFLIENSNI
jgi:hypothetical protein